jgi:hypothetical protein
VFILEKYFPASRAANIRKEICGIRQLHGETLFKYWGQFEKLYNQCPYHQIPNQLLIQYFYKGLMPQDKSIIDAASGGVLVDKTPKDACYLITNMATNSKNFGTRADAYTKRVNEVSSSNLESQIQALSSSQKELTSFVRSLMYGGAISQTCSIYRMNDHTVEFCSQMHDEQVA